MPRCSCAACGRPSLRGDGSIRIEEFECGECDGDGKFDLADFDKYILCENYACRCKISVSCFQDLVVSTKEAMQKMKKGEKLDDSTGFWRALLNDEHEMALAGTTMGNIFSAKDAFKPASVKLCFFCEDVFIEEPPPRTTEELRDEEADLDPPVTVLVPVLRKGPDCVDLPELELKHIELIFAWPLVYTEACADHFRGRVATHEEVGGEPLLSIPSQPHPTRPPPPPPRSISPRLVLTLSQMSCSSTTRRRPSRRASGPPSKPCKIWGGPSSRWRAGGSSATPTRVAQRHSAWPRCRRAIMAG